MDILKVRSLIKYSGFSTWALEKQQKPCLPGGGGSLSGGLRARERALNAVSGAPPHPPRPSRGDLGDERASEEFRRSSGPAPLRLSADLGSAVCVLTFI